VPEYYYKVILNNSKDNPSAIGFILPNQASSLDLKYFATSIDEVEEKTGIDFFPLLPDNVEGSLEKNVCTECWDWRINRVSSNKTTTEENSSTTSVQCSGITAAGARCKRMTKSPSRRCYQHE
jgi:endonuclease G